MAPLPEIHPAAQRIRASGKEIRVLYEVHEPQAQIPKTCSQMAACICREWI